MPREDPDRLIRDVGYRIAELRAAKGLTQEQFAEKLGVAAQNFRRIERNGQNLTLKTMAAIASVLDVRVIDLLQPPKDREVRVGRPPRQKPLSPGEPSTRVGGRRRRS